MRWPWQRARHFKDHRYYSRWPKKVYFLDGPMQGKTGHTTLGGFQVLVPYLPPAPESRASWFSGDDVLPISSAFQVKLWRYSWETCYPTAEVAYVTFAG